MISYLRTTQPKLLATASSSIKLKSSLFSLHTLQLFSCWWSVLISDLWYLRAYIYLGLPQALRDHCIYAAWIAAYMPMHSTSHGMYYRVATLSPTHGWLIIHTCHVTAYASQSAFCTRASLAPSRYAQLDPAVSDVQLSTLMHTNCPRFLSGRQ